MQKPLVMTDIQRPACALGLRTRFDTIEAASTTTRNDTATRAFRGARAMIGKPKPLTRAAFEAFHRALSSHPEGSSRRRDGRVPVEVTHRARPVQPGESVRCCTYALGNRVARGLLSPYGHGWRFRQRVYLPLLSLQVDRNSDRRVVTSWVELSCSKCARSSDSVLQLRQRCPSRTLDTSSAIRLTDPLG
jgi:hypothetical protein